MSESNSQTWVEPFLLVSHTKYGTTARHFQNVLRHWLPKLRGMTRTLRLRHLNAKRSLRPPPRRLRHDLLMTLLWSDALDHEGCRCELCTWRRLIPMVGEARREPIILVRKR